MKKNDLELVGLDIMGENLRTKVKYCGEGVRLYPLCKMIRPEKAELDDHCQIFDYVFIDAGTKLQIGKYSTVTWHCLIEGGSETIIGDRVFLGPGTKVLNSTYKLNGYYTVEHLPGDCNEIFPSFEALVKGKLEPWTVYVGTPCKPIGKRVPPTEKRQEQLQEADWTKHF